MRATVAAAGADEAIFTSALQQICIAVAVTIIIYASLELAFGLKAEVAVKVVKLVGLIWMNIHTEQLVYEAGGHQYFMRQFRRTIYRVIRGYVWFAAVVVAVSIGLSLCPECSPLRQMSEWERRLIDTYVINIIALLPVFIYACANHYIINKKGTAKKTRIHLQHFLYFVNVPLCTSIIAFGLLACCVLHWEPTQESVFVNGAAALLIFISSSMTICIDEHADASLYRAPKKQDRWWTYGLVSMAWIMVGGIVLGVLVFGAIHSGLAVGFGLLLGGASQGVHGLFGTGSKVYVHIAIGFFYSWAGFMILNGTGIASILSIGLAAVIIMSALLRCYLAYHSSRGWLLAISGGFGVLAGTLILIGGPTNLWLTSGWGVIFWCSLTLDLLTHAIWWLLLSREEYRSQRSAMMAENSANI